MDLLITIAVVGVLLLLIVWGVFNFLLLLKVAKPKNASVLVRVLCVIFVAVAGAYVLFLSPISIRPTFGDMLFMIIAGVVIFLMIFFVVLTTRAAIRKK